MNRNSTSHFYFHLSEELDGLESAYLPHEILERLNESQTSKQSDSAFARELEERFHQRECASRTVLKVLHNTLNDFHGIDYSEESWRLLLGHWIERYVSSYVQREFDLRRILSEPKLAKASVKPGTALEVASDTEDAIRVFNSMSWDAYVYKGLLETFHPSFPVDASPIVVKSKSPEVESRKHGLKKQVLLFANLLSRLVSSRARYFLHTTYLPLLASAKIHLALGQVPQLWHSENSKPLAPLNFKLRRELRQKFSENYVALGEATALEKMLVENISYVLPVSFLEGFRALGREVESRGWPRKPKVIFTSNRFDTDDVFKLYVVEKRKLGALYVVGQHGNNYGTKRTMFPSIEEQTSDKFFTWGWNPNVSKYVALFNLKMSGIHYFQSAPDGEVLLLQTHRPHAFELENPFVSHDRYFDWQKQFYSRLDIQAKSLLRVRLHSGHAFFAWGESERWSGMLTSGSALTSSEEPIFKQFSKSRLVVHTYDSTGMLETLAGNVPTVAFWPLGMSHLTNEAEEDYQKLIAVKIIHTSPESAANHINLVLQDIDAWWGSSAVQKVRADFVSKYSRLSPRPIRELTHALRGDESFAR